MTLSYFDLTAIVAPVPPDWNGVSELQNGPLKKAAVQLLLAGPPHRLEILLTRRSDKLRLHAGQVSFPGGKPEAVDETPAMTAARECQEETGLSAQLITHLGYLEPVLTSTNYLVDQVVGYCAEDPRQLEILLQPNPAEVDMTWFTPLAPFLIIDAYKRSERLSEDGRLRRFWKIPHSDPMIWGATAQMLRNLAVCLNTRIQPKLDNL